MDNDTIQALLKQNDLPGNYDDRELIETHISWVILAGNRVFKLKKPFKYSFLDFSTLEKRKYYCEEELRLNSRLAASMYNRVLPIIETFEDVYIDQQKDNQTGEAGAIIDYALEMNRMDSDLAMDILLQENRVNAGDIDKIAEKIADFHDRTEIIKKPFNIDAYKQKFEDITSVKDWLIEKGFDKEVTLIEEAIEASRSFLKANEHYLKKRNDEGYVKDCHGDLHSKNIFLYDDPVIFDCIEFNAHFRQIDTLNEIAFFCMDLEAWGFYQLSDRFFNLYCQLMPNESYQSKDTRKAFTFFKSYRANVRGKVIALKLKEQDKTSLDSEQSRLEAMKHYFHQMHYYLTKGNEI